MLQVNLFAGQEQRSRLRDLWTQQGKKRMRQTGRVALMHIRCHGLNRQLMGSCCADKELSSGLCDHPEGWGEGEVGGRLKGEGHMYTYG